MYVCVYIYILHSFLRRFTYYWWLPLYPSFSLFLIKCRWPLVGDRIVYLWTLPMFHCNGWCFPWAVTAGERLRPPCYFPFVTFGCHSESALGYGSSSGLAFFWFGFWLVPEFGSVFLMFSGDVLTFLTHSQLHFKLSGLRPSLVVSRTEG